MVGFEQVEWNCLIILALRRLFSFLAREENIRSENSESALAQPNKAPRAIDERRANNISYNHRELGDARITATRWPVTT